MTERPLCPAVFWRGDSGEQSAVFRLTTGNGALQAGIAEHPEALREISEPSAKAGQAEHRKAEGQLLPPSSNRSPAKRVRFEKEEGGSGYGALAALTQTAEAEWSELLLTTVKGRGQSGIGMEPHRQNRPKPVTLNTGG